MQVTLIGKDKMYKLILPQIPIGSYWISDTTGEKEKKLINIEGVSGRWNVVSNDFVNVIDFDSINVDKDEIKILKTKENVKRRVEIMEYHFYGITFHNSNKFFVLYCSPVNENTFMHYDTKNVQEISIGSDASNLITYENKLVAKVHAKIYLDKGRWTIENLDLNFGTFVNSETVNKTRTLFNGDVIFIMGLKIIIMGNSIYINNPLNTVVCKSPNIILHKEQKIVLKNNNSEYESEALYKDKDYFFKSPRITENIEVEKVKIDPPPSAESKEEMPLILTLGTTLTMGLMMLMSTMSTISSVMSGNAPMGRIILSTLTSVLMLVGMIVFPLLTIRYQRKLKKKHEEKRQTRYREYINKKITTINNIMDKQRQNLLDNYPSTEECIKIILDKSPRLWERKIEDWDFLAVKLGMGDIQSKIDIQYPEERFTMEDDDLMEMLSKIGDKSKILKDAPITINLTEKNLLAILAQNDENTQKFLQSLIVQLIAFHSYEDLKMVFFVSKDTTKNWKYLKMLPHVWDNSKRIRFFTDKYNEMEEISKYLEEEFNGRLQNNDSRGSTFKIPYYLIITDDYKKISTLKIIQSIVKAQMNWGFSILCVGDNLAELPNECKTFIGIEDDVGKIYESEMASKTWKEFNLDTSNTIYFDKIINKIANIPIKFSATDNFELPSGYSFLEMYDVGKIEELNILDRWKKNDTTLSLAAPLGIDTSGRTIFLDIHEKYHGPHGLIAGSTGSGKSEFIITYILSLAVNYHPDDLAFILIDYKGGGLAGAFQKRDIKLPHLVGTITNIDTNGLQRSLASVQSELRRRQVLFNEARDKTDEGTIDIYKYQKLYHEGVVDKPIPHLLIICDEFAELKQQQPDFMDELMSVSRIGRSLGVHLILATQKPAGIVNDQIRSNSKFAVCLKVQDKSDSTDVIKKPDAAYLKLAGQFYLQVGNDEYFVLGQSAWSGAPYFPSDVVKKKEDNSIEVISNIGSVVKKVDTHLAKALNSKGEQLTNILKYICDLAKRENIKLDSLWLDNIPETIYIKETRDKYNERPKENNIELVVGEFDDPANQRQGPVKFDIINGGNIIIFGNADSGKETLLSSVIYDAITNYSTDDIWFYILDFGSEALKIFRKAPHVGDIVFADDDEKIDRFFKMIQNEIASRKATLSDYNGEYNLYIKTSGKAMPMISIIINNFESFSENYGDKYDDIMLTLTREGLSCGIMFIITASSTTDMRYRLSQNFKQKVALQVNKEDDYYNIFDKVGKKRPSHIFGRGLITIDSNEVFEFQTAKICDPVDWNTFIKSEIDRIKQTEKTTAMPIPTMPNIVTFEHVERELKGIESVPLGITKEEFKIYTYNFAKDFINIVTAKNIDDSIIFITNIIEELNKLDNVEVSIFDAERMRKGNQTVKLKDEYKKFVMKINGDDKKRVAIIIGIDRFLSEIDGGEESFREVLSGTEELGNYNYIVVDSAQRIKSHEYDKWYKSYISGETGIWVGNGCNDQYLINISASRRTIDNNCGDSYGYVIKRGNPTLIKLLGLKEKGDDDE